MASKQKNKKTSPSYRVALRKSLTFIADNMSNLEMVFIQLVAKGALTFDEVEEIKSKTSTNQKIMEMMHKFSRKSKKDFTNLMTVLNETGQEDVAEEIGLNRQQAKADKKSGKTEDEDEDEVRGGSKNKKKKGKMYSIYLASDEEDNAEEDEEEDKNEFDSENPNITLDTLTDYLAYLDKFFKHLNFDPTGWYTVHRFRNGQFPNPSGNRKPNLTRTNGKYENKLRFRVSRAVFLDKIGFYGPEVAGVASYDVDTKVTVWPDEKEVLGSTQEVIEVVNRHIMYVTPGGKDPIPIRPHVWHMITFSIKGREIMVAQQPENIAPYVIVPYHPSAGRTFTGHRLDGQTGDSVVFEFDVTGDWSSCQIPELTFYKGKNRIPSSAFPIISEPNIPSILPNEKAKKGAKKEAKKEGKEEDVNDSACCVIV